MIICNICEEVIDEYELLSDHILKKHPKSQLPKDDFLICENENHLKFEVLKEFTTLVGYVKYIENGVNINPNGNTTTTRYKCLECGTEYLKNETYGEYIIKNPNGDEIYNSKGKEYKGIKTMKEIKDLKNFKNEPKDFRVFNQKTKDLTYFDFFDINDKKIDLDFSLMSNGSCVSIINSFTGRYDNDEIPKPLYEGDILEVIKTNVLIKDDIKIGIIEYIPNYSAFGVVFNDGESKLLHECYENTIIKLGTVYDEVK